MTNIRLNFLPLKENNFTFNVYRKKIEEGDVRCQDEMWHSLPIDVDLTNRERYRVSFEEKVNFDKFTCESFYAIGLTKHYLHKILVNSLSVAAPPFTFSEKKDFTDVKVEFVYKEFQKGNQIVSLIASYIEEQKAFGFIIEFRFARNNAYPFNKEIQILSLSLDISGRSNKNYYLDKYKIISNFIEICYPTLNTLHKTDIQSIELERSLLDLPAFLLNKKEYLFNNNKVANSQFQGVKSYGPLHKIIEEVIFVFIFEERFKNFANELYLSLIGKLNPGTFSGLEPMFGLRLGINNTKSIKIQKADEDSISSIVNDMINIRQEHAAKKVIGIFVEDYDIDDDENSASHYYYSLKYQFIKNKIPLQVVNYRKLGERNSLKWSTSNLALAIFAKLGGIPWIVRPSNNNCLILGIGSAHKKNPDTGHIIKYFAYTVCLDSSGLYKTLKILADEDNEANYLEKLSTSLKSLFEEGQWDSYKKCVLHIPFKIKKNEIAAITKAINQVNAVDFTVIKVNLHNKYFGFGYHNTLVPYESSYVKLSHSEYLVWFEGLLYGKEAVDKRLSSPVHIQFLNLKGTSHTEERGYLQDVLNLSGANWRGFNAKSIPISIYYSQIIAKYTEQFEGLLAYDEQAISNETPWFL